MSRILKQTHASAQRLHAACFLDAMTMREFDALCLPPVPTYSPEDVQRIRAASQAICRKTGDVMSKSLAEIKAGFPADRVTKIESRAMQIMAEASGHTKSDAKLILLKIKELRWELKPSDPKSD